METGSVKIAAMLRVAAAMESHRGQCGGGTFCSQCSDVAGKRGNACPSRLYLFTTGGVLSGEPGVYRD
jgi:hypothetical protein